jgi:hypothetical protein
VVVELEEAPARGGGLHERLLDHVLGLGCVAGHAVQLHDQASVGDREDVPELGLRVVP